MLAHVLCRRTGSHLAETGANARINCIGTCCSGRGCIFMLIASAIISGLGLGSMYGLLALGFHVTYAVSGTVNFAQGSTMMLGAVLCFTF